MRVEMSTLERYIQLWNAARTDAYIFPTRSRICIAAREQKLVSRPESQFYIMLSCPYMMHLYLYYHKICVLTCICYVMLCTPMYTKTITYCCKTSIQQKICIERIFQENFPNLHRTTYIRVEPTFSSYWQSWKN